MKKIIGLNFNNSYLSLPKCFYESTHPTPVKDPEILIFNKKLSLDLGIDFSNLTSKEKAKILSGNTILDNNGYYSQAYAGHQYGHFTILGDGRAIIIGEHITPSKKRVDIQLKGSGQTPFSRGGDGRSPLGPALREYIISEAMYNLGIPTTRSLAVVKTGENITRDQLLAGGILTRVASSHLRIGTFELASFTNKSTKPLELLLDYSIERHYPELKKSKNKAISFFNAVMEKQIDLILNWIRVGFIHGVMNTDNTTISGETIDYGPCAFMDNYNPNTVFSSIDRMGRYSYQNQPEIIKWNLAKLAESLLPLIDNDINNAVEIAQNRINLFDNIYQEKWLQMMKNKLGIIDENKSDSILIADLLDWMKKNSVDFTNTFADLTDKNILSKKQYKCQNFKGWYIRWQNRITQNNNTVSNAIKIMQTTNPDVIPRNHKVEQAIEAAYKNDINPTKELLKALQSPYKYNENFKEYKTPPSNSERIYQTFCGT